MRLIATRLYRKFSKSADTRGLFPVAIATGDLGNLSLCVDRVLKQVFLLDLWKRDVKVIRSTLRSWVMNHVDHPEASSGLLPLMTTTTVSHLSSRSLLILRNLFATVGLFQVSGLVDDAYVHSLESEISANPKREFVTEAIFRRAVGGNLSSAIELMAMVESSNFSSKVKSRLPALRIFLLGLPRSEASKVPRPSQEGMDSEVSGKPDSDPVLLLGPGRLSSAKIKNPSLRQAHLLGPGNDPNNYPPTALLYMRRHTYTRMISSGRFSGSDSWVGRAILDEPHSQKVAITAQTLSYISPGFKSIGSNFNPLVGPLAALDLLAKGAEIVHVDGIDFYLSRVAYRPEALRDLASGSKLDRDNQGEKQFLDGSNGRGSFERCKILAGHCVIENILISKFLLETKRLSVEENLRKVLELDSLEVHFRLDELYGVDRK